VEKNRIVWAIGIIFMIMPMILLFTLYKTRNSFILTYPYVMLIPLIIGLLLFIYGVINEKTLDLWKMQFNDERTKKIRYKTLSYSLPVTIVFIIILSILFQYKLIELELNDLVSLVLLQVGITGCIFQSYFRKKKDV
jgi:hypothetical protein